MKNIMRASKKLSLRLITALFLLSSLQAFAQPPHEFAVFGGLGFPRFTPAKQGIFSSGLGGDLGGSFTGFVNDNVGFHVGLGISFYRIEAGADSIYTLTEGHWDTNHREYDLHSWLKNYNESHRMVFLSIPLMLQFQTTPGGGGGWNRRTVSGHAFYALTGLKLNVLINNDYTTEVEELYNLAYYPALNNWGDTQRFAGYGIFKGKSADWKFDFSVLTLFTIEAGGKWQIADNLYLYTGLFLDYGLNDPTKKNRAPSSEYIFPASLNNFQLIEYSDRIHLLNFGIKLRFAFTSGKSNSQMSCPAFK
jgi:hypothetical protein